MTIRAFAPVLLAALVTVLVTILVTGAVPAAAVAPGPVPDARVVVVDPDDDTTRPTINEFYPEQRPLSDCLSSLPKPNCGSEARGGWAQNVVFAAIVGGLAIIAWRIVVAARRARRAEPRVTPGRRDATSVPADPGDDRAP